MNPPRSLSQAVADYLAWLKVSRKSATVDWYRHFLEKFSKHLGDVSLTDVNRLHIETFSGSHHPLAALRAFFRWCRRVAKYVKKNPCKNVRVPPKRKRRRVLDRSELVTLRRRSSRVLRHAILALEESGMRPHEMRTVAWEQIRSCASGLDRDGELSGGYCYFDFEDFKASDRRADQGVGKRVPITPRLGRLLVRLRRRVTVPVGYIFLSQSGRPWSPNALRCAWRRLRTRVTDQGRVSKVGLVPYALRHTMGTSLHRGGENAFTIRDWLGQIDIETTSIYVHSSIADLCAVGRARDERRKKAVK